MCDVRTHWDRKESAEHTRIAGAFTSLSAGDTQGAPVEFVFLTVASSYNFC
jgi:hypothetical protein